MLFPMQIARQREFLFEWKGPLDDRQSAVI
jgi:hypothetical protein